VAKPPLGLLSPAAAPSREGHSTTRSSREVLHQRWGRGRVSHAMPKEKKRADRRGRPARSRDELTTTASCQGEKATACQDQARKSCTDNYIALERIPVFDREDSALFDHDLMGRDLRRLGGLHVARSFRLVERASEPEAGGRGDNSSYCSQNTDLAHRVTLCGVWPARPSKRWQANSICET